ncbi:hypothetical protein MSAN_00876600 [Mycena sanguinolenta]|uniref:Uncharacterized protein n=1 Tax=Mycena sanguinolenta TaxID=230812 RepID=A0A8H6Z0E8_9AGAR|nr:hypothetical protein MSAN_00876600 [Mycena sanguinolenta]
MLEMPVPRSGLQTREKNKHIRPGVKAGVEKKTRRTPAEMQKARAADAAKQNKADRDREKSKQRLAALEDKQQEDDIAYANTANHPPSRTPKPTAVATVDEAGGGVKGNDIHPKNAPDSGRRFGAGQQTSKESQGYDEEEWSQQIQENGFTRSKCRDDSMVAPGGPALDDDTAEHIERPQSGKKKKGVPTASLIAIQPAPPRAPTLKELRGGSAKWHLKHLPIGTQLQFKEEVVPLACELAGSQQIAPWGKLTLSQLQSIVDRVYGKGEHTVTAESAWVGLIGYRLNDWRHGMAARPHKYITHLVESYEPSDSEDNDEDVGEEPPRDEPEDENNVNPAVAEDADAQLTTTTKHLKFNGTMAFHWKTWGDGVKKGFLQSPLLLYTLAYHLECLDDIPGAYERLDSHLESALLMSAQAVERELQFWRSGDYVHPSTKDQSAFFSIDNWDDKYEIVDTPRGKKKKLIRRATKFRSTVQDWKDTQWDNVVESAKAFMEIPSRKRGQTVSCSSSEVGDDIIDDDEVMVLSD